MNLEKVFGHIDQNINAHTKIIQEFITQPSISPSNIGIQKSGKLLNQYFHDLGCQDVGWAGEYPILYGDYDGGAQKTLLIYLMFDTGPSPFPLNELQTYDSDFLQISPYGNCLAVKGAIGYKAFLRAFLNALESIKAVEGSLPVNLKFVCDGEEMLGSPHLPQFIDENRTRLDNINAVLWPRSTQDTTGKAQVTLGGKGMMGFRLECSGNSWGRGPINTTTHSSNQASVDSPVWRLIQALATMTEKDGNTVLIDGFYNEVLPPTEEELGLVDTLIADFSTEAFQKSIGVQHFINDLQGKPLLIRHLFTPTFNIELESGDYDSFGVGRMAHKATAKIQIRLVPNQTINSLLKSIQTHLDQHGYSDIKVLPFYGIGWGRSKLNDAITQAVLQTYQEKELKVEIWPTSPATPPPALFSRKFGISFMSGGVGYSGTTKDWGYFVLDGNEHVAGLAECEKTFVTILDKFATLD